MDFAPTLLQSNYRCILWLTRSQRVCSSGVFAVSRKGRGKRDGIYPNAQKRSWCRIHERLFTVINTTWSENFFYLLSAHSTLFVPDSVSVNVPSAGVRASCRSAADPCVIMS